MDEARQSLKEGIQAWKEIHALHTTPAPGSLQGPSQGSAGVGSPTRKSQGQAKSVKRMTQEGFHTLSQKSIVSMPRPSFCFPFFLSSFPPSWSLGVVSWHAR